jgi:hypothetical protein
MKGSCSIPHARLSREGEGILIYPAMAGNQTNAYALCRLPRSLADQLGTACQWFWQRHQRCLGILLLLEPEHHIWSVVIPAQRCSRDSACWSASRRDLPGIGPSMVLMGSFQSRMLGKGEDPADCPPPHDGLHLVMSIGSGLPQVHTFLRCDGQTRPVPVSDVLFDDIEHLFEEAIGRLKFT